MNKLEKAAFAWCDDKIDGCCRVCESKAFEGGAKWFAAEMRKRAEINPLRLIADLVEGKEIAALVWGSLDDAPELRQFADRGQPDDEDLPAATTKNGGSK